MKKVLRYIGIFFRWILDGIIHFLGGYSGIDMYKERKKTKDALDDIECAKKSADAATKKYEELAERIKHIHVSVDISNMPKWIIGNSAGKEIIKSKVNSAIIAQIAPYVSYYAENGVAHASIAVCEKR